MPGFLNGLIDEVEVFDRTLADGEIAAIYNAGSAGKCKPGKIIIKKGVEGGLPPCNNVWAFTGTGPIGNFTLPVEGGSETFTGLPSGNYTISELLTNPGYTTSVCCDTGETGVDSVTVGLSPGETVTCTFKNTKVKFPTKLELRWGPLCTDCDPYVGFWARLINLNTGQVIIPPSGQPIYIYFYLYGDPAESAVHAAQIYTSGANAGWSYSGAFWLKGGKNYQAKARFNGNDQYQASETSITFWVDSYPGTPEYEPVPE